MTDLRGIAVTISKSLLGPVSSKRIASRGAAFASPRRPKGWALGSCRSRRRRRRSHSRRPGRLRHSAGWRGAVFHGEPQGYPYPPAKAIHGTPSSNCTPACSTPSCGQQTCVTAVEEPAEWTRLAYGWLCHSPTRLAGSHRHPSSGCTECGRARAGGACTPAPCRAAAAGRARRPTAISHAQHVQVGTNHDQRSAVQAQVRLARWQRRGYAPLDSGVSGQRATLSGREGGAAAC